MLVNTNRVRPIVAPIGLDYLAASLLGKGHEVDILDLALVKDVRSAIRSYFSNHWVNLIGVTIRNTDDCYLASQEFFIPAVAQVVGWIKKESEAPIVLGGCGFSIAPERILESCGARYGIWGDGEEALPCLMEALSEGKDLSDVPNLVWRSSSGYVRNQTQFVDLNQLDLSTRPVVDSLTYFSQGGQGSIETKRGCQQSCIYCADPVARGKKYRLRSSESVADELTILLDRGINCFHLCDSEFNQPGSHARAICEEIIKRGLGSKIKWYGYLSPFPFSEELAALMKKAGCVGIDFGVDSGSDGILERLGRNFTTREIAEVANICHRKQITFMFDLLLGGPGETRSSIKETVDLMRKLKPTRVGVSMGVRIYPGTLLAEQVVAEGTTAKNENLFGKVSGNKDFFEPIFYISSKVGSGMGGYVESLIEGDKKFFFANPDSPEQNYNYNENLRLVEAIRGGYRGAYWDILRQLGERERD